MWTEICAKGPADFEPNTELLEANSALAATDHWPIEPIRSAVINNIYAQFNRVFKAYSSARADKCRILAALDQINRLAFDQYNRGAVLGWKFPSGLDSSPERFSHAHWLAVDIDDTRTEIEDSFVGLAARIGFVAYVQAKVKGNRSLLEPKHLRISLLENAIFREREALKTNMTAGGYTFCAGTHQKERFEVIQFLLDTSDTQFETAYGDSMFETVRSAMIESAEESSRWDEGSEWYTRVLELLEEHGYGPSTTGHSKDEDPQNLGTAISGGQTSRSTETGGLKKTKKRPGVFKRAVLRLRSQRWSE